MRRTHTNIAVYIFSNVSHILERSLLISTGVVENVQIVNMSAWWDPPSNTGGEITCYRSRIRYTVANGRRRYVYKNHSPTERHWTHDLPAERPVYFQVRNQVATASHVEYLVMYVRNVVT